MFSTWFRPRFSARRRCSRQVPSTRTSLALEMLECRDTPSGGPFSYDPATGILTITGTNFSYSQSSTLGSTGVLQTTFSFAMDGQTQSYTDAQLTHVIVNGTGAAPTANFVTNDTFTNAAGTTLETQEYIEFGNGADGHLFRFGGPGNFLEYHNFPTTYAVAGPADSGVLLGTGGEANTLASFGVYTYLSAPGQFHWITGARSIYGYSTGPQDVAYLYDGSDPSTYTAAGTDYAMMSGYDQGHPFLNEAFGFELTQGIATHTGDTAYLYSGSGAGMYVASGMAYSLMWGTENGLSFYNQATGFQFNNGIGKPGEIACFYDSPLNDVLLAAPYLTQMYSVGPGGSYAYYDSAQAFTTMYAYSFVGGTDYAYLSGGFSRNNVSGWIIY